MPHLFAAALCAYAVVDLLLARGRPRLAGVDYSRVAEPLVLNARAARRLAVLPVIALVNAGLAGFGVIHGRWLWAAFVFAVLAVIVAITIEVRRARRQATV